MARTFRPLIFSCGLLTLGTVLAGIPERRVTFTVFSPETPRALSYVPQPQSETVRLELYPTARSRPYVYEGARQLKLLDDLTQAIIAEADLPEGIRRALLIVWRERPRDVRSAWQVTVLDDEGAWHRPDQLRIINRSGLRLEGSINGTAVVLAEGDDITRSVGRSAKVALRTRVRGRSYQSCVVTIPLEATECALVLLLPPYQAGAVEVQTRVLTDGTQFPGSVRAR